MVGLDLGNAFLACSCLVIIRQQFLDLPHPTPSVLDDLVDRRLQRTRALVSQFPTRIDVAIHGIEQSRVIDAQVDNLGQSRDFPALPAVGCRKVTLPERLSRGHAAARERDDRGQCRERGPHDASRADTTRSVPRNATFMARS